MKIELIVVGDEILKGHTRERNDAYLGRALEAVGLVPWRITALGDDRGQIAAELAAAAERSRAVIVTGGLGPTFDDVTRQAAIEAFGGADEARPEIVERIRRRFESCGAVMPETYRDLERIPAGAVVLENRLGAAPGLWISRQGCDLFLLPGVPAEMGDIFISAVMPVLKPHGVPAGQVLRVFGPGETQVERILGEALGRPLPPGLSIISAPTAVSVYLPAGLGGAELELIRQALGAHLFGTGNDSLEETVTALLAARGLTLATAESVSGGLLASMIVSVPGASAVFLEGCVAYSNESKIRLLGVEADALERAGAVSSEVCRQMARGARRAAGADFAVATTGIAGPGGATAGKPVGLCYIGLAAAQGVECRELRLPGDRSLVRSRAACTGLDMLRRELLRGAVGPAQEE